MNFDDANFNIKSYFAETYYTTSDARPRTTCLQGLICATFTKVVLIEMDDAAAANDGVGTHQVNLVIEEIELRCPVLICLNVSKITNVTMAGVRAPVMLSKRIVMRSKAITPIIIVGKIAKLMNVKSMPAVRGKSFNSSKYLCLSVSIFIPCL